ncbi:hypothetical protein [Synechococcus phage DSL-LC02]|nr:hypothetical protein [Synechococcus phage DSL-LC02]
MSYATKALAVASALLMGAPAALAHTNSIGYVGDGAGSVTFWYGSWHAGTTFTEGSMTLQGVNGTNFTPTTVNWTLLQNTTPTGLIPGTNYFQSDGVNLVPYGDPTALYGMPSYTWQGVTFNNLGAGDYQFQYNPIAQPTQDWDPSSQVIRTGTVTLSSGLLSGDADGDGINDSTGQPVTPTTPTVVSTAPGNDIVTTSTSNGTRTVTNTPHRHVMGTDANGNQTETHYTDTQVITIPTVITTTTTTPVTVTTWSDGSTTTANGTPVVTTSTTDAGNGTSVVTQATIADWVKTRTYNIVQSSTTNHIASENNEVQTVDFDTATTTTTTAIYTKVYTNGSPTVVTNDAPVSTVVHTYKSISGRVDQLKVLGDIGGAVNDTLNHEPSPSQKRFRLFENNRVMYSSNSDGYQALSTVFGGGFEYDLTKGWTFGSQYNQIHSEMLGVDSHSHSNRKHIGIFNSLHGKTLSLVTNAGASQDKYDYSRTMKFVLNNWGQVDGSQWWVNNRLHWHLAKGFQPFIGHTVRNVQRNSYTETGSTQSTRSVAEFNETTHVGEAGLKLETRFGGKKGNLFGVGVEGYYGTDSSYGVTAEVDYREVISVEGTHSYNDGMNNSSVAAKIKFKF